MSDTNKVLQEVCRKLLVSIGEDPAREGLVKTPARFARVFEELTVGYKQSADDIVRGAIFHEECSQLVLVRDIEFYSMCEHHLLPFFGKVTVGYIPRGKIVGLSKIPRIVDMFARRLQLQERFTQQIANEVMRLVEPAGVACLVQAHHLCTMMRGIEAQSSMMVTNSMLGVFADNEQHREEFLMLVRG